MSPPACRFPWTTPGRCPSRPCAAERSRKPSSTCSASAPAWRSARPPTGSRPSRIWSADAGSKWKRPSAMPYGRERSSVFRCPRSRPATGSCPESTATSRPESPSAPHPFSSRLLARGERLSSNGDPLPKGEGETLHREAPHAADRGLVGKGELGQGEVGREVLEDHANPLADGHLALRLRLEIGCYEVADDAERLVRRGRAALLVQLDQYHRIRRPLLEAGLNGVVHHLVGIDVTLAADVLPLPLERHAPRAAVARRVAHEPAARARAQHQLVVLTRQLEVLAPLRVVLRDHQIHAAIFDAGHRAISSPPHPALSPSRGKGGVRADV